MKKFVVRMIDSYEISPTATHIGVVEFSEKAKLKIPFDRTYNPKELKRLVNEIEPSDENRRNTDLAFQLAKRELLSPGGGSRSYVPRIVILVTAGRSTGRISLRNAVQPLRGDGVRVYVIGVGDRTDRRELTSVVADKKDLHEVNTPEETPLVATDVLNGIKSYTKKSKISGIIRTFKMWGSLSDPQQICGGTV